ncbi:MAG: hypothetical protein HY718_09700 [Planctomycetes bacterium]|nr:hypothetical protein [Planctomycetota bacterium]
MLTEIFAATESELKGMDLGLSPLGRFPTLESWGVQPLMIAQLQAILEESDLKDTDCVLERTAEPLRVAGDEGPWVYPVPTSMRDALAGADVDGIRPVADQWFATEEWRLEDWPREAFDEWLDELLELAEEAIEADRQLYLWVCQ